MIVEDQEYRFADDSLDFKFKCQIRCGTWKITVNCVQKLSKDAQIRQEWIRSEIGWIMH